MGVGRLIDKAKRYGKGIAGLEKDDVLLVSYPKSGNTWVRFFFGNLISKMELDGGEVDFKTVDSTMPEFGKDDLKESWPYKSVPRIVKTHNPFWFPFKGRRTVYVVRDPRDVAVSHYHYITGMKNVLFEGTFQQFIRSPKYGLDQWFKHTKSWQGNYSIMVHYEDLLADDTAQFTRILETLKVQVDPQLLESVVESSRFNNLKKTVEKSGHSFQGFKPDYNFMRSGKSKSWVEYFDKDDLELYRRLSESYGLNLYNPTT